MPWPRVPSTSWAAAPRRLLLLFAAPGPYLQTMLILAILLFGMLVGAGAQLVLGTRSHGVNWTTALVAGLLGSFIGGLLISLLSGDGLALRPSGIIGSIVGAVLVTLAWSYWQGRQHKVT